MKLIRSMKYEVNTKDLNKLDLAFEEILEKYINIETARYCRKRYLENFSLEQFEKNLLEVLR